MHYDYLESRKHAGTAHPGSFCSGGKKGFSPTNNSLAGWHISRRPKKCGTAQQPASRMQQAHSRSAATENRSSNAGYPFGLRFLGKHAFLAWSRINQAGFTFIELMATLVVASVLATLAAPALTNFVADQRITDEANDLVGDLNLARSEAIRTGSYVVVCKSTNPGTTTPSCDISSATDPWTTGRLIFTDTDAASPPGSNQYSSGSDTLLRVRLQLDGTYNKLLGDATATGTGNQIVFQSDGTTLLSSNSNEYQLLLCDNRGGSHALAVVINWVGRARVTQKGKDLNGNAIVCP
ncbi:MAG: GspH/FimT family pseudopilin [Sulfuricaulis sp.]